MNFASITFVYYFLPLTIGLYYLCHVVTRKSVHNIAFKNIVLLAASLLFYAWGEGIYLVILLGSIVFNHIIGLQIHRRKSRTTLFIGIAFNVLLLTTFKYGNWILKDMGLVGDTPELFHLPLGISFFTFQAISMLVDIHRGTPPAKNLLGSGVYIAMFPQLIAGPIVRFDAINGDIQSRKESYGRFAAGVQIFILGLAQKTLIADTLAITADSAFSAQALNLTPSAAWIGLICFSLQIFYDFAGYSNMAIGLGRFFGFELPRNFNYPYSAKSFQDFWRRWHITLSTWFRDYLYIPLGGARDGSLKTYRNLLIVFILCGLWHGAAWTFLLWGLWHGVFLIAERLGRRHALSVPTFISVAYVWLFVSLGWVLFRAENLPHAIDYWRALFGLTTPEQTAFIDMAGTVKISLVIALLCVWDGWEKLYKSMTVKYANSTLYQTLSHGIVWGMIGLIYIICFFTIAAQTHRAFIYFRF